MQSRAGMRQFHGSSRLGMTLSSMVMVMPSRDSMVTGRKDGGLAEQCAVCAKKGACKDDIRVVYPVKIRHRDRKWHRHGMEVPQLADDVWPKILLFSEDFTF